MSKKDMQYDASPEEVRLVAERRKLRQALKAEYLRKVTSPYNKHEGHLFDPSVQRYFSMHATITERFVPTWKNFAQFMGLSIIPVALYAYILYYRYEKFDKKCRTGEIRYEDRLFKFDN